MRRIPQVIELWQGDHLNQLYDVRSAETGGVKDLSSASGVAKISRDSADASAELTPTVSIVAPGTDGKLRVTSSNIQLAPGTYFLQVIVTDAAGIKSTIAEDTLIVKASLNN